MDRKSGTYDYAILAFASRWKLDVFCDPRVAYCEKVNVQILLSDEYGLLEINRSGNTITYFFRPSLHHADLTILPAIGLGVLRCPKSQNI